VCRQSYHLGFSPVDVTPRGIRGLKHFTASAAGSNKLSRWQCWYSGSTSGGGGGGVKVGSSWFTSWFWSWFLVVLQVGLGSESCG